MDYQICKEIGSMYAVLNGDIYGLILTGGLVRSGKWVNDLKKRLSFIRRVFCYPGSFELQALADGAGRALRNPDLIREYK